MQFKLPVDACIWYCRNWKFPESSLISILDHIEVWTLEEEILKLLNYLIGASMLSQCQIPEPASNLFGNTQDRKESDDIYREHEAKYQ